MLGRVLGAWFVSTENERQAPQVLPGTQTLQSVAFLSQPFPLPISLQAICLWPLALAVSSSGSVRVTYLTSVCFRSSGQLGSRPMGIKRAWVCKAFLGEFLL